MNKKILLFVLLIGLTWIDLWAQEPIRQELAKTATPFLALSIVDSENLRETVPPSFLVLSIEVKGDVFYKLSDDNGPVRGGKFFKGTNFLSLKTEDFFQRSGSYNFELEVKSGNSIQRKEFEIDIHLEQENKIEKTVEEKKKYEYELTMYIDDQMVASSKKIIEKTKMKVVPDVKARWEPFGPPPKDDLSGSSFPILGVLAAATQMIKKAIDSKKERDRVKPLIKSQQVMASFFRVDSAGTEKQVRAVITLNVH